MLNLNGNLFGRSVRKPVKDEETTANQPRQLKLFVWGLVAGWTLVVVSLLLFNVRNEHEQAYETARTQARSSYQRDVIYRHWVAGYGAFYTPVIRDIEPNPYLADIPERDVTTPSGQKLTMVNPAYMTRLVFDMATREYGTKDRITSLRPIRPANRPDPWEATALKALEGGREEVSSVEKLAGVAYLRLMMPLKTEEGCLKCHGKQGYKFGEVRGGISVAVPMEPLLRIARQNTLMSALSFSLLWLAGLTGIFTGAVRLRRLIRERDRAGVEIAALNQGLMMKTSELEAANRELDAFCATVSHDLMAPITVIGGYCQLVQETPAENCLEKCGEYSRIIYQETLRMEKLIDILLDFSRLTQKELQREKVDLSGMAGEIVTDLRRKEPGRLVVFRIAEDMTAYGDAPLLRVVLQNLLGNSWKYTSKKEEGLIEFGVTEREGKSVFFVRDNGVGFDMAPAEHIFEPFQRLRSAAEFKGSGVGLATVKRIIERHGGRIWAEGEAGVGATFRFTL